MISARTTGRGYCKPTSGDPAMDRAYKSIAEAIKKANDNEKEISRLKKVIERLRRKLDN